jgi:hypothetical protein
MWPEDLRLPVDLLLFLLVLVDALDLLRELREVAVLRPLVVGERDGDPHVGRLDDVGQLELLAPAALTGPF